MAEGTVNSRDPAQTAARVTATATAIIGLGVVTAATGVVVLVWPEATLQVIAVVFGIFAVTDGVLRLVSALIADARSEGWRMLLALQGVLSVLVGIVVLRHPFQTLAVLTLLLGLFWVVGGLLQVVHGLGSPAMRGRAWSVGAGLISLAAGIVVLAYTSATLLVLVWLLGLQLLLGGALLVGWGIIVMQRDERDERAPDPPQQTSAYGKHRTHRSTQA
ncbi:hypothetical protein DMH04_54120 [Kibdelosporangium aridum]|uniref:HdeD family acid-resistance protein n=1 Tax=Kibdelosporangium aridum TaxID=2030 RepID=A0A428XYG1_KIBAR|nr:DUF308 domain-containing protein [Kibdelosporangium aridum]RSM60385.1 hypothetical protein DMH04_54120 [Kibdelosporangium aridum]